MRGTVRGRWLVRVWLACGVVVSALAFMAGVTPAHATESAHATACGGSSSATSGASTQSAKGSARISLNTTHGVAGTLVVVSGSGWPVGQHVFISVENLTDEHDGVNGTGWLSGATTGADGTFATPAFTFPYAVCGVRPKAGTTASIVAANGDSSVRAVAPFTLAQTPKLDIVALQSLTPLPAGATSIAVTGGDWIPGAAVSLVAAHREPDTYAEGNQRQTATPFPDAQPVRATADTQGGLAANVPVPPGLPPGTEVNIHATATSRSYGALVIDLYPEALIPAPVPPTWDLNTTRGEAGATLSVTGDHWWPVDIILIEYCRIEASSASPLGEQCNDGPRGNVSTGYAAQLGTAEADARGHFTATVTLPPDAKPGSILVQARLSRDNNRAAVYFQSHGFLLMAPAPHAQPIAIRWQDWWRQALVVALLLSAALFVFWPRITQTARRRATSVAALSGQPDPREEI